MAVYKSITPIDFYVLYNVLRLWFTKNYNIEKYGIYSKRIASRYEKDKLRKVYDYLASKIYNKQEAIFLICSNFIKDRNNFITNFELDVCYNNQFKRYHNNKLALIEDFDEYTKRNNIIHKVNSGELADDVIMRKEHFVLFVYINKVLPLVTLAKQNTNTPDTVLDLFYGIIKDNKREDDSLFDKVSYFISITEHHEQVKHALSNILERERSNNQNRFNQNLNTNTEEIIYDTIYC